MNTQLQQQPTFSLEQLSALALRSFSSYQEALNAILQQAAAQTGMRSSFISQIDLENKRLRLLATYNEPGGCNLLADTVLPLQDTFCETIALAPEPAPLLLADIQHNPLLRNKLPAQALPQLASYIGVPVTLTDGSFFGTLCTVDSEPHSVTNEHASLLLVLARMLATQLELEREAIERLRMEQHLKQAQEELQEAHDVLTMLGTTDPITRQPNHRALLMALENMLEQASFTQEPCAICFVDLDHFKAINDVYGHAIGDIILREFAAFLRANIRLEDNIGRWGGEQFLLLLPQTDEEGARYMSERMRQMIATHNFSIGGGIHLTASLGLSVFPSLSSDMTTLLDNASKALRAAKKLGRNQIRFSNEAALTVLDTSYEQAGKREELTVAGTVEALASLAQARDACTAGHMDEVASLVIALAELHGMQNNEILMLSYAARLHDIGKIAIPDAILNKPGPLTTEEWLIMRTHAAIGAEIISRIPVLSTVAPIIRSHHEYWNGAGYPDRLAGEDIPIGARIIAVADAYGAMTADRPYRQAQEPAWALAELQRCSGTQFDPALVASLIDILHTKRRQSAYPDPTHTTKRRKDEHEGQRTGS